MIIIDGQLVSFESTDKLGLNGFLMKSKTNNKTLIIHSMEWAETFTGIHLFNQ